MNLFELNFKTALELQQFLAGFRKLVEPVQPEAAPEEPKCPEYTNCHACNDDQKAAPTQGLDVDAIVEPLENALLIKRIEFFFHFLNDLSNSQDPNIEVTVEDLASIYHQTFREALYDMDA